MCNNTWTASFARGMMKLVLNIGPLGNDEQVVCACVRNSPKLNHHHQKEGPAASEVFMRVGG